MLYLAETLLATLSEYLLDGLTHAALDIPVEVIEHHAGVLGERLANGGLARPHIAYQDDASHFFCFSMMAIHSA